MSGKAWFIVLLIGLGPMIRTASAQQPGVVGDAFRVSSETGLTQSLPSVCSDPNGNFVVGWASFGDDFRSGAVLARRFDADANSRGPEIVVNEVTRIASDDQLDIACANDGGFIVVWSSRSGTLGPARVSARVFESNGDPRTGELAVSQAAPLSFVSPAVAVDGTGSFVVVFIDAQRLRARRFDRNGNPAGAEILISDGLIARDPDVQFDTESRLLVVWQQEISGTTFDSGVFGQRFDGFGLPLGDAFLVKRLSTAHVTRPKGAFSATGTFVVAWSEVYDDGGSGGPASDGVRARRYSNQGQPLAGDLVVSPSSQGYYPQIGLGGSDPGHFMVVWIEGDSGSTDVFGRFFDPLGTPQGSEFQVSATSNGTTEVSATRLQNGEMIVAWTDPPDPSGPTEVFARRVQAPVPTASPTPESDDPDSGIGCGTIYPGGPPGPRPGSALLAIAVGLTLMRGRWSRRLLVHHRVQPDHF